MILRRNFAKDLRKTSVKVRKNQIKAMKNLFIQYLDHLEAKYGI
jgi:hypothetical protein